MSTEKSLFDHLNAIYQDQTLEYYDSLTDKEKKSYNKYMLNRFISMNVSYAEVINEIQKYSKLPDRVHYIFFSNMLPRKKQFNKYIKKSKDRDYPEWLVTLLQDHYKLSKREILDYLKIFCMSEQNLENLKTICEKYAVDKKQLKEIDKLGDF